MVNHSYSTMSELWQKNCEIICGPWTTKKTLNLYFPLFKN